MKTVNIYLSVAIVIVVVLISYRSQAQNKPASAASTVEVIQFHSENRCMTCNKIEELTRETLKAYSNVSFSLVNVDDKKNEKKADEFEAAGTALFLYNSKTGKKKDLTDFAFMNASNKDKFIAGLKKEINAFLK